MQSALLALCRAAARFPRATLGLIAAMTVLAGAGLLSLELRTAGQALVPRSDPVVLSDAEVRRHFGLRDSIVVLIESHHPEGIYNRETLSRLRDLSNDLAAIPGIGSEWVMSLASEARPRVYPGTFRFRPLLDPFPDTPELMERLRADIKAIGILTGTLVTQDGRAAAILIGAPPSLWADPSGADRAALYALIERAASRYENDAHRIRVVGAPVAEALLGSHILADLRLLVPVAMALIAAVIWLVCRRRWAVALALIEVGGCLIFTFGMMGWRDVPVYLTTGILPVILTAIGVADELHVLWRYQQMLGRGESAEDAVSRAMESMARPVTITSITTALGFLSFLVAPIRAIAVFGVFAALGVAYCWLFTMTAIPAALTLIDREEMQRPSWPAMAPLASALPRRLFEGLLQHSRRTLTLLGVLAALIGVGVLGVRVQDSWIDGFSPASEFRRASEFADRHLDGTHVLLAHIAFAPEAAEWPVLRDGRSGPLLEPQVLRAIRRFESALEEIPGVGGVLGPGSHIETVNHLFLAQRSDTRRIPDHAVRVGMVLDKFDLARGVRRRREVIHDDLHQAVVTLFVHGANYRDTAEIMKAARAAQAEYLLPLGARMRFAGDLAVSQAMIPAIVRSQLGSLALACAGALLLTRWFLGSFRLACLAVAPTAAAVLCLFGAMGWLEIPIGVATSTFCAITFGIGIDYAVHLLERIRQLDSGALCAPTRPETLLRALRETAPPILADAVSVSLGFAILMVSRVPANGRLGVIIAVALLAAALFTLVGLPAWLTSRPAARH